MADPSSVADAMTHIDSIVASVRVCVSTLPPTSPPPERLSAKGKPSRWSHSGRCWKSTSSGLPT